MKKTYETPAAEKIEFQYEDQMLASSVENCRDVWVNIGVNSCTDGNSHLEHLF